MKMAETERRTKNQWLSSEPSLTVEINGHDLFVAEPMITRINGSDFCAPQRQKNNDAYNLNLGIGERTFSAAGAAFLSAIIVNPLDVVKVMITGTDFLFLFVFFWSYYCLLCRCSLYPLF